MPKGSVASCPLHDVQAVARVIHVLKCIVFIAFILIFPILGYAQINFSTLPQNGQLFSRNIVSNVATVKIKGKATLNLYSSIKVLIYKNNTLFDSLFQSLSYIGSIAEFDFSVLLNAEPSSYNLKIVGIKNNNTSTTIKTVTGLLSGDAYLINGQSNAFAAPEHEAQPE